MDHKIKTRNHQRSFRAEVPENFKADSVLILSFSSEEPAPQVIQNEKGEEEVIDEILDHSPESIDLSRFANGTAPFLLDHDSTKLAGVIESAEIKDKRGIARIRLSKRADLEGVRQDIADGIRASTSVGYSVSKYVRCEDKEVNGRRCFRAVAWTPLEISSVAIPADATVGIGRSAKDAENETVLSDAKPESEGKPKDQEAQKSEGEKPEDAPKPEGEKKPEGEAAPSESPSSKNEEDDKRDGEEKPTITVKESTNMDETAKKAAQAEKLRAANIRKVGAQFGLQNEAEQAVDSDISEREFNDKVLELIAKRGASNKPTTAEIGMSGKEQKRYSLLKLVRALSNPNNARLQSEAAFELEASEAAQKVRKTDRGGMTATVPFDMIKRDLAISTGSGLTNASGLVATNLLASEMVDVLRPQTVCAAAGARVLAGLVGNVAIPRMDNAATPYWVADNIAVTESDQTFDQISLVPHTLGAMTNISHKLLIQSTPSAEAIVRDDISKIIAIGLDQAMLTGLAASGQPVGILNQTGIGSVTWDSAATPTFGKLVALESALNSANALAGRLAYVGNSAMIGLLKTTAKSLTGQTNASFPVALLEPEKDDTGLLAGELNGYSCYRSNLMPANTVLFGNFEELLLAIWGGFDLLVDPFSNAASGGVRVRALVDVDVAVRHAASFAKATNPA